MTKKDTTVNASAGLGLVDLEDKRAALATDLAGLRAWDWRQRAALNESITELDGLIAAERERLRQAEKLLNEVVRSSELDKARQAERQADDDLRAAVDSMLVVLGHLQTAQAAVIAAGAGVANSPGTVLARACQQALDAWRWWDPERPGRERAAYLAGLRDDVAIARQRLKDAQALPGDRSGARDATIRRCWYGVRSRERILARALGQDFSELSSEEEDHQIRQACAGMVWQAPSIADVEKSLRGGVTRILKGA